MALETRITNTVMVQYEKYGVTPEEFKNEVMPDLSPSMAAQFFGQYLYCTLIGGLCQFSLYAFIATLFIYEKTRDSILSSFGISILWILLGIIFQALVINNVLDKVVTKSEKKSITDPWPTMTIERPVAFALLFPVAAFFHCFVGVVDGTKRTMTFFAVMLKVLLRPDRTILREGGFKQDGLFTSFMATLMLCHNNGSRAF